ncbi:hypothetical protein SAMN02745823_03736 [Sporobacter termitidis DSM 10068]|uniref:Uncharacterized protein n=1 Tax=Sporobacter termitidis DSM 10068 TaxID=1123282 RepID=A0A1M5ZGY9_9FIRM|nr:hypothetical protein [Sporobacter termitidis]SHI23545.1 hypothetical protein SAMN02745823_03736 [Sporobacter termitidis DSM 10068]
MRNETSQKIQNFAGVLFYCIIALSVIAGISYLMLLQGISGAVALLIAVAMGTLLAFLYKYVCTGFGEIVEHQAEQTALLIKMTELMKDVANAGPATGSVTPRTAEAPAPAKAEADDGPNTPAVRLTTRAVGEIVCPVCRKPQLSNRNSCYSCGCRFIYDDEQPAGR